MGGYSQSQLSLGESQIFTIYRANSQASSQSKVMSLDCWRKPEYFKRAHLYMGRTYWHPGSLVREWLDQSVPFEEKEAVPASVVLLMRLQSAAGAQISMDVAVPAFQSKLHISSLQKSKAPHWKFFFGGKNAFAFLLPSFSKILFYQLAPLLLSNDNSCL